MSIIADLIRAGVDPELVARVAEELDAASSAKQRTRARTQIDAAPISFDLDFARRHGLDEQHEFQQFLDYHRKHGSLMADWHAAWRTWVRNAIKFQARAAPAGRSNGVRGFLANVAEMMNGTDIRTEGRNGSAHQGILGLPERRG